MKPPILLRIYMNDKLEGVRQFDQKQVVIGRNAEVQLDLSDNAVSPLHAVIEERESGYYLSDLGSQTGTLKNGSRILDEKLESGDEIKVGPYRIQFFIGVPKPTAPPSKDKAKPASSLTDSPAPLKAVPPPEKVAPPIEKPVKVPSEIPKIVEEAVPPTDKVASTRGPRTPTSIPSAPTPGAQAMPKTKGKGTYAPGSAVVDVKDIVRPNKGTVVEVLVAWKERIIAARHFKESGPITVGSDPTSDVVVPLFGAGTKIKLVQLGTTATACISQEMTGELIRDGGSVTFAELFKQNKMRSAGSQFELDIPQGEMVRIGFQGNLLSVFVRYVPETPKPLVAPLLDLTTAEVTGVISATVIAAIFGLYMTIYEPKNLQDEAHEEQPLRRAIVTFNAPVPKPVVQAEEKPVQEEKKVVEIVDKPQTAQAPTAVEQKGESGKTSEVAPKENPDKKKTATSARPGGAIKSAPKEGATAKSDKPDPTKVGLLGVFGTKGTQKNLDKTFSGAGDLTGMAESATGFAGNAENRQGDVIGTKIKDTGAGGKGTATVGISGVGTKGGKGTGTYGLGTGGIGTKGSVEIDVGGQEAEFSGSIDKEAIRRIIQQNKNAIRSCYERSLQRKPDLYGKLVIEWDIIEKGRVSRTAVKSNSLGDDEVATCIMGRIKSLRFPEPPPDVIGRVTFPFVFSSQ